MVKTIAPLLSFGASGQIAKTQVYASWKGRQYARRYTVPRASRTTSQADTRDAFKTLTAIWKFAPAEVVSSYEAYARTSAFTGVNGLVKRNLAALRTAVNMQLLILSPGALSGFPATAMVITPGSTQLSVALTAPALPTGWTIVKAVAVAIKDQDPGVPTNLAMKVATDATSPYACVITGLTNGTSYVVNGWFEYLRPDGKTAYGQALIGTGTPA